MVWSYQGQFVLAVVVYAYLDDRVARLAEMKDEDIDPSDIPEFTEEQWSKAEIFRPARPQISLVVSCLKRLLTRVRFGQLNFFRWNQHDLSVFFYSNRPAG